LTRSLDRLNSSTRRIWLRMGSLASSAMLWVTIGGSEFRFNANTLRLSKILSSEDKRSSGLGTSVPCSLEMSQFVSKAWKGAWLLTSSTNGILNSPSVSSSVFEDPLSDPSCHLGNRLPKLLGNGLSLERLDGI